MRDDRIYSKEATERLYKELQRLHDFWIYSDFWRSIEPWDIDRMKEALKEGADPNATITVNRPDVFVTGYKSPLYWSLFQKNDAYYPEKAEQRISETKTILKLFADYGADFNKEDSLGYTCFNSEWAGRSYLPIRELIDAGADMSIKSYFGNTVLHRFISNLIIYPTKEIMPSLEAILKTDIDINAVSDRYKYSMSKDSEPAFGALCRRYVANKKLGNLRCDKEEADKLYREMMKKMVLHGADINQPIKSTISEDPIPAIELLPRELQKEIIGFQKYTEETKTTEDYDIDAYER